MFLEPPSMSDGARRDQGAQIPEQQQDFSGCFGVRSTACCSTIAPGNFRTLTVYAAPAFFEDQTSTASSRKARVASAAAGGANEVLPRRSRDYSLRKRRLRQDDSSS